MFWCAFVLGIDLSSVAAMHCLVDRVGGSVTTKWVCVTRDGAGRLVEDASRQYRQRLLFWQETESPIVKQLRSPVLARTYGPKASTRNQVVNYSGLTFLCKHCWLFSGHLLAFFSTGHGPRRTRVLCSQVFYILVVVVVSTGGRYSLDLFFGAVVVINELLSVPFSL